MDRDKHAVGAGLVLGHTPGKGRVLTRLPRPWSAPISPGSTRTGSGAWGGHLRSVICLVCLRAPARPCSLLGVPALCSGATCPDGLRPARLLGSNQHFLHARFFATLRPSLIPSLVTTFCFALIWRVLWAFNNRSALCQADSGESEKRSVCAGHRWVRAAITPSALCPLPKRWAEQEGGREGGCAVLTLTGLGFCPPGRSV